MWKLFARRRDAPAVPGDLWQVTLRSKSDFESMVAVHAPLFAARRNWEKSLAKALPADEATSLSGYCAVCGKESNFRYDHQYAESGTVNWRERLLCAHCGLNNRQRLALHVLAAQMDRRRARIYATEQTTPTARSLARLYPEVMLSEFLGPGWQGGQHDRSGLRHEDVTRLSFASDQFDRVLSFDVLEHVPDYRAALREFARVTRRGGRLLLTVPQHLGSEQNVVRAKLDGAGCPVHLMPPEYHGDPVNPESGILCYYHFGWELLRDLLDAGFDDAFVTLWWSREFAYVGYEQAVLTAVKAA